MFDPRRKQLLIKEERIDCVHYTHLTAYLWVRSECVFVCLHAWACYRVLLGKPLIHFPLWGTIKEWVHCDCALSTSRRHPSWGAAGPPIFATQAPGEGLNESQIAPPVWALWWYPPVQYRNRADHTWTPVTQYTKLCVADSIKSIFNPLLHTFMLFYSAKTYLVLFDTHLFCLSQVNKSDSSENPPSMFALNTRPLNPAEHQMFWQPFFRDLHGNYIPLCKHKNTSSTMCCVIEGQSHQCMGMNLKASLTNWKWIGAVRAADSEKMSFQPSLLFTGCPEKCFLQSNQTDSGP